MSNDVKSIRRYDKKMRFIGLAGLMLFVLSIIYPVLIYGMMVRPAYGTEKAKTSIVPNASAASVNASENSTVVAQPSSNSNAVSSISPDAKKQASELARYEALIDYLKIFLPTFSALVLAVIGTLGYYYVETRVLNALNSIKEELQSKVKTAEDAITTASETFKKATLNLNEFEQLMEELISIRIESGLVRLDHALSLTNWRAEGGCSDAIKYGERNMERVDDLMPRLQRRYDSLVLKKEQQKEMEITSSNRGSAVLNENIESTKICLEEMKEFSVAIKNDLAYFYAERFSSDKKYADREKSLKIAREIAPILDVITDHEECINAIDNYLFIISRSLEDLESEDWETFVKYYNKYQDVIRNNVRILGGDDITIFQSYVDAAEKFKVKLQGCKLI